MPPTSGVGADIADGASVPSLEKEKDEESEKVVQALGTVKVSHFSLFPSLLLAMVLPRVILRVCLTLAGAVSVGLWVRAAFERGEGCGGSDQPALPIFRI